MKRAKMMNTSVRKLGLILTVAFLIPVSTVVSAQDVNFTQYNYTPFQVNPGIVASKSELQVSVIDRMSTLQNGHQANTLGLTGIYPLISKNNQHLGGLGINVFSDRVGAPAFYQHNGISLGFAYNLNLNKCNKVSFGLQPGFFQKRISSAEFTTGNQWVSNVGFDPGVSIGETFNDNSISYLSLSSGLYWSNVDEVGMQKAFLGISGFNLNRANSSFISRDQVHSSIKFVSNGGIRMVNKQSFSIFSEIIYINLYRSKYFNVGPLFNFHFSVPPFSLLKPGTITAGLKYANNNTILTSIQLVQPSYIIGFSYDIGFGNTTKYANTNNGSEIMISFRKPISRKRKEYRLIEKYSVGEVRDFYQNENKVAEEERELASKFKSREIENEDTVIDESAPIKFALKREFKFKFNDSEITDAEDVSFMEDLIRLLNSNKKLKMEIIGHADNKGTSEANLKISEQRAIVVFNYLVLHGIDKRRLSTIGKGDKEPIVKNDSETHRAINRRVEFLISK